MVNRKEDQAECSGEIGGVPLNLKHKVDPSVSLPWMDLPFFFILGYLPQIY